MFTKSLRFAGTALGILAVLSALILTPGHASAADTAPASTDAAPQCLTLADGSGKRITTGTGGSTVGTATRRACPAPAPAPAAMPETAPPPVAAPVSAAPTPPAAPTPATPKRAPRPAAAPMPEPVTVAPVARPLPIQHFTSGAVELHADAQRAPRSTPPLALQITPARLTATVITGGAAMLLLNSGLWTSLLILGLPLWRHVDLLPIVDGAAAPPRRRGLNAEPELAPLLDRAPHSRFDRQAKS